MIHSKTSSQMNSIGIVLIGFGMMVGASVIVLSLWLWFDYQADPAHSMLAVASTELAKLMPLVLKDVVGNQARLMGLPLTEQTAAYWYMARAGGVVAYLLLWLSTMWGLCLSTKVVREWLPSPLAYGLHEYLSIMAVLFTAVHALVLLGDETIKFNILHLVVPFIAPYEPLWTGLGIIALHMIVVITASFYIRKQIGQVAWRLLHYLTFVTFGLAFLHGIMAGTDGALAVMRIVYLGTGLSTLFLVYYRLFTLKMKKLSFSIH